MDAETHTPAQRGHRTQDFHGLMRHRIMDILLVASPYDAFILDEAGEVARNGGEFGHLDLHYSPGLTGVSSGAEALALTREQARFNLIVSALHVGDMSAVELARRVREAGLHIPVVALAFDHRELRDFVARPEAREVERTFLWQGDARILPAIVKYVEDKTNVAHDTRAMGVQVILLVEDSIRYYSSFLPAIYDELLRQQQRLLPEGVNLSHKILRMRARPKILLCDHYEEAVRQFDAYAEDVLGVISDMDFPRAGRSDPHAGLDLAARVRKTYPDVPLILHSSRPENAALAHRAQADFLLKDSPRLLADLRRIMTDDFGFGDFVFRVPPERNEVARASDLRGLADELRRVPAASIEYHVQRNHFSKWLKARTEFAVAGALRPQQLSDFADVEDMRAFLVRSIERYRHERSQYLVADFDRARFDGGEEFCRIGGGSLGGKARGLWFMRTLLAEERLGHAFDGVAVQVPPCVVLATDVFDRFLDQNGLRDFAIRCGDDRELERRFQQAPLPSEVRRDLQAYLERERRPVAVRSSSLLEDSRYQPFTGVYDTLMLSNDQGTAAERVRALEAAVKRVYASTFSERAKRHVASTVYRLEEEKMAVIVQRLVGRPHGRRFYPDFAGVARSHNFYPAPGQDPEDGVAAVALGFGRTVVEGGNCLRFCPRFPLHPAPFSSAPDVLRNSQATFWALVRPDEAGADACEAPFGLEVAEADGTLAAVASTFSAANEALYDGVSRPGVRVVTFAPVLKLGLFPLAEVLTRLLRLGVWGLGAPVELEFAVDLARSPEGMQQFAFLQLRPLSPTREVAELELRGIQPERLVCHSSCVLGHGTIDDVRDVVVVPRGSFDRSLSQVTAAELARFNALLGSAGRPYLLVGVGRWGSHDPWLGIPVTWEQISGARAIVEAGFADLRVTPSQGTHFFQNLNSYNVGYFTVNPDVGDGFVDWDWLAAQEACEETATVRHLRFERPLVVKMNGRRREGVIFKP